MTDEKIVKACAEKVMGWEHVHDPSDLIADTFGMNQFGQVLVSCKHEEWRVWNPLTSDADACAVLDALIARPHVIVNLLMSLNPRGWWVEVGHPDRHTRFWCADRRRAIVLAALKAVGVNA